MTDAACIWCGEPATLLCDTLIDGPGLIVQGFASKTADYVTCDSAMCESCTTRLWSTLCFHTGDTWDRCPYCAMIHDRDDYPRAPWSIGAQFTVV